MKKQFERQEERIDEKFKDISVTMEKNQESLLTTFQTQKSEVQDQLNQLVQSVMVIGNLVKNSKDKLILSANDKRLMTTPLKELSGPAKNTVI
eukprot:1087811-Ditylum_brightwellii.AAC.1